MRVITEDNAVDIIEEQDKEIERLKEENECMSYKIDWLEQKLRDTNNIINELEKYFEFLKMNSTGGNKEFTEAILNYIKALRELEGSDKE